MKSDIKLEQAVWEVGSMAIGMITTCAMHYYAIPDAT